VFCLFSLCCYLQCPLVLLPYMNKLVVNVPKADMIEVLQNSDVLLSKFTDKTRVALQNTGKLETKH